MLSNDRWFEMLQRTYQGGRNYTFCKILTKNRGRNTTFSSFLLQYRGRNYTNFPRTWKEGRNGGAYVTVSNLHRVSTLPGLQISYICLTLFSTVMTVHRNIGVIVQYSGQSQCRLWWPALWSDSLDRLAYSWTVHVMLTCELWNLDDKWLYIGGQG